VDGPDIIANTLSRPSGPDRYGNVWQYHSRSNRHTKVASWAVLYDLLQHSPRLAEHATAGKIVFGIDQQMLVISRPGPGTLRKQAATMYSLAVEWDIRLTPAQQQTLAELAPLAEGPTGDVLVALEAKACMTEHVKALTRLSAELTATYATVHGANPQAIAVGIAVINASKIFLSSDRNKYDLNQRHPTVNDHPANAPERAVEKVRKIHRRTADSTRDGFDAFGTIVVDMRNDGSPVTVVSASPAPAPEDADSYQRMIGQIVESYDDTFGGI
jgi:hypothetical protein